MMPHGLDLNAEPPIDWDEISEWEGPAYELDYDLVWTDEGASQEEQSGGNGEGGGRARAAGQRRANVAAGDGSAGQQRSDEAAGAVGHARADGGPTGHDGATDDGIAATGFVPAADGEGTGQGRSDGATASGTAAVGKYLLDVHVFSFKMFPLYA
ncbi:circumsporozoite protein-like isoform X1 [Panicum virgatum]|uniref:circumsporozoite protein-like isoform X1 n=1 Tax=Panicum virgatum TaxID=38727 RepID=UPI0019D66276|nr:circumsporozoite protein-like isoform X1 [Panicum virgatum]